MSDVGWPTPGGATLHLTAGHDFTWGYQLTDSAGNPTNFPAGNLFIEFPTVNSASFGIVGPASGSMWKFTVYGSVATITVPASIVNAIPNNAPWHLVWVPDPQIVFDSSGDTYAGTGTPTWTHNVAGDGLVVFANVLVNSSSPGTVTATCSGVAMTNLATVTNYYAAGGIWVSHFAFGLLNPPTGSTTVAMSISAPYFAVGSSLSYKNVASFEPAVTANKSGMMAMSVVSPGNRMVAQSFSGYTGALSNYTQRQRVYIPFSGAGYVALLLGDAPIGPIDHQPALTFSAINAGGGPWGGIAVPLVPKTVSSAAGYSTNSGLVSKV